MKRIFSESINELNGEPARVPLDPKRILAAISRLPAEVVNQVYVELEKEGAKPFTYSDAACDALIAGFEREENTPIDQKLKRFKLALRISDAAEGVPIEVTLDEAKEIKERVNKAYTGALIPARVSEFFEGE